MRWRWSAVVAAAWGAAVAGPASGQCGDVVPIPAAPGPTRLPTPDDLLGLRDIGYPDPLIAGGPSPLAVSPDGRAVAFVLNRADAATNGYCRALLVVPLAGGAPRVVDTGGDLITLTDVQRGMFVRGGFPGLATPVWSPDGRWIAYPKREKGVTALWRVRADGGAAQAVTDLATDIEAIAWSDNGTRLLFTTRPAKAVVAAAIDAESRAGWLYDDRVVTFSGPRPQIREAEASLVAYSLDPATGDRRAARPDEAARLGLAGAAALTAGLTALAPDGRRATVVLTGFGSASPSAIRIDGNGVPDTICTAAACNGGIVGLWWTADGRALRFLRREGWNREVTALYEWHPDRESPRRLFATTDALIGCVPAGDGFVCTRENATTPRRLVRLEPRTGRSTTLFDPNPEFARIAFPKVERLRFKNNRGLEAWADLVLPFGYRRGTRYPLVVVQYSSRGFLRGGTGDEYPIFALAAHGFAVLSMEKPPHVAALDPTIKDLRARLLAGERGWAERRSSLSAIETAVHLAIGRGIADPARIGITGLSDGATTARFALLNSTLFSAASISSCCLEPWTVNTYVGIAYADHIQSMGYPSLIRPDPDFWRPMSLAQNAARMNIPLLLQLNDDDGYVMALEAFESLREYGKPVEMYVFPGEFHTKWQPVHRLAIYRRNLDWFDFWLRGREDPDPAKATQYGRWRVLRAKRDAARAGSP